MSQIIDSSKKKYIDYVKKKLKKYKVDSPTKVPGKHKKKFFKELDKGWESKEEKANKSENKKSEIVEEASSKTAGFWTQKIVSHKNMSKIKNLIIDMKEDLMGEDYSEADEDKFVSDFVRTIDPLLAGVKIAPKQPPKGWWEMMHTKMKAKNPEYDKVTLDKVIGDIWYNKMKGPKKKEVMKEYEG